MGFIFPRFVFNYMPEIDPMAARIDHTVLGPQTTFNDVKRVVDEAEEYGMNVCIPPSLVGDAYHYADKDTVICTVIGFPHGTHRKEIKMGEAGNAVKFGADEVDVVARLDNIIEKNESGLRSEIESVVDHTSVPVKVIIESHLFDEEQVRFASEVISDTGADYIKTSTGFSNGGAELDDVRIMSEYMPVKASGGIGSWGRMKKFLEAGADRIGASSGVTLIEEYLDQK